MIFIAFITLGSVMLTIDYLKNSHKTKDEVVSLTLLFFILAVISVTLPFFSIQLGAWRIYHLSLIMISPLGIIGGFKFFNVLLKSAKKTFSNSNYESLSKKIIAIFLLIFLLFNTTWMYQITGEAPESIRTIALHQDIISDSSDAAKNSFYASYYIDQDVKSMTWLSKYWDNKTKIYCDGARATLIINCYGLISDQSKLTNNTFLKDGEIIYLGYPNVKFELMYGPKLNEYWRISESNEIFRQSNLIYNVEESKIFKFINK
jgi:uncharacterized membrane protein